MRLSLGRSIASFAIFIQFHSINLYLCIFLSIQSLTSVHQRLWPVPALLRDSVNDLGHRLARLRLRLSQRFVPLGLRQMRMRQIRAEELSDVVIADGTRWISGVRHGEVERGGPGEGGVRVRVERAAAPGGAVGAVEGESGVCCVHLCVRGFMREFRRAGILGRELRTDVSGRACTTGPE